MTTRADIDFYITSGDAGKIMTVTLCDAKGDPVPLTGATITFSMGDGCGNDVITNQPAVQDADQITNKGVVRYTFTALQTAQTGNFKGQFKVVVGGTTLTYPTRPLAIEIERKVAP